MSGLGTPRGLEATPRERLLSARSTAVTAVSGLAAAALVVPFASIVLEVARRAGSAPLSPAILATLSVAVAASVIAVPVGVGAGVYLAEFGAGRLGRAVRVAADVVGGLPSIVVGAFVYVVARQLVDPRGFRSAQPAAACALAVMMVPRIARMSDQALRAVPAHLREAALVLGVPRWRTVLFVMLRTAAPGVIRGALVALARVIGEAAPLLVIGTLHGSAPLSVRVAELGESGSGWAAAAVLLSIVLSLNLAARTR